LEKLEGGVHPYFCDRDGIGALFPRADDRTGAERIGADAAERVPVGDREAQVGADGFAVDLLVGIVVAEREGVRGAGAFVGDWLDFREMRAGFFHAKGSRR
jgi:hypothetical protein